MRTFIGFLVAACVLVAAYVLGNDRAFCFTSGSLDSRGIEQSANRSSSRPSIRFVVQFTVNGVVRSVGGVYQPAPSTQNTWVDREHKLAEAWIERHPIGTAIEVAYLCKIPTVAAVKEDSWKLNIVLGLFISSIAYLVPLIAGCLIVMKLVKASKKWRS
jgi:hypothetical protein